MNLNTKVDVLDLRIAKTVNSSEIVERLQQALDDKKLGTQLSLLPSVEPDNVEKIKLHRNQRVLVLLDQLPDLVGDRYSLTKKIRTKVACQHINVNPNDLTGDSIEKNLLVEQSDDDGNTYLIPEAGSSYYEYNISQFDQKLCKEALKRNAEIVIKELELKHLLLSHDAKISTSLPEQKDLLTGNLIVITDGYLFTVKNDRPVMLPFNPAEPSHVEDCNKVLIAFNTSVASLLNLLQQNWPYSYKPEAVMQGFGSPAEKLNRFAHRLTIVIHKSNIVSISFQDPKYETPHMLPLNLDEAIERLESQNLNLPLHRWQLPQTNEMIKQIEQLMEDGELASGRKNKLLRELDSLTNSWKDALRHVAHSGTTKIDYERIRQDCFNRFLEQKNACLELEEKPKKRNDATLISSWTKLLSRIFDLPLGDGREWLRNVPGIQRLWHDPEQGYYVVGGLAPLKKQIQRQPSIRQWHALQGKLDTELLIALVDVDWVRVNQLAGNPCVATLVKRWRECQSSPNEALKAI